MNALDTLTREATQGSAPARGVDTARIAYVVLAHSDPELFGQLMRRLDDPRAVSFAHIDAKASLGRRDKLFIRKFSSAASAEALDRLDATAGA